MITIRKIYDSKSVLSILIVAIALGLLLNALFSGIERLIYPEDYYDTVMKYSEEYNVPHHLIFAVIKVESDFDRRAKSSAGAMGLMQLMPSTYEWLAEINGEIAFTSALYEPEVNIKYGTYYLQYLYSKFGTWEKALVAYNWGEGRLQNYIEENGYEDGDYTEIPVKETRNYVKKVLHHWEKYKELYKYKQLKGI